MRIARPILLVGTPVGVLGGLQEAWHFSPGLAFLMAGLVGMMGFAVAGLVATVRREQAEETARRAAAGREGEGDAWPGAGDPGTTPRPVPPRSVS